MSRFIAIRGAAAAALSFFVSLQPAVAQTAVGKITACYYSAECKYTRSAGFTGIVDGPAFEFTNTSSTAITSATFIIASNKSLGIAKDAYRIGTIDPGKSRIIVVGGTNDHKVHRTTSFFYFIGKGDALDTSDDGPDADTVKFSFTGKLGAAAVTSGTILTGATAGPSKDGTVAHLNFLGGPGNADGPCNDCFAPATIATLTVASGTAAPR